MLINNIFSNANIFKANAKLSKYSESVSFRAELNMNIFEAIKTGQKNDIDKYFNKNLFGAERIKNK